MKPDTCPFYPAELTNNYTQPIMGWSGEQIPAGATVQYPGISIRDHIATEAMKSFLSSWGNNLVTAALPATIKLVSETAYKYADAMIALQATDKSDFKIMQGKR